MRRHNGLLVVAVVTAASAAIVGISADAANAAPQSGSAGGLSAKTDSAVVLVGTDFTATIQVPQPQLSQSAIQELTGIAVREAATGQIGTDTTSITSELLRLIERNPDRYLSAARRISSRPS